MNSKGMELAINQVVILLISIVILGLGIAFVARIFTAAEQTLPGIDSRTEEALRNALSSGEIVEMPINIKTIGANDLATFDMVILNDPKVSTPVGSTTSNDKFSVLISFNKAIDRRGNDLCASGCTTQIKTLLLEPGFTLSGSLWSQTYTILPNDYKFIKFGVLPRNKGVAYAGPGQYFYNVCVCQNSCASGSTAITSCDATSYESNVDSANKYSFLTFSVIVQ
jgi:hypothetical protein